MCVHVCARVRDRHYHPRTIALPERTAIVVPAHTAVSPPLPPLPLPRRKEPRGAQKIKGCHLLLASVWVYLRKCLRTSSLLPRSSNLSQHHNAVAAVENNPPRTLCNGKMRVVAISLTMMAVCLAVELSEEQHENLPDFGDPKVGKHAYITRGCQNHHIARPKLRRHSNARVLVRVLLQSRSEYS